MLKTNHCVLCVVRLTQWMESRQGEGLFHFILFFFPIYPTRAPFKTSRLNRYRCASLATAAAAAVAPSIATAGHKKKKSRVRIYINLLLLLSLYYIHQTPTLLYGTNLDHRMGCSPHIII